MPSPARTTERGRRRHRASDLIPSATGAGPPRGDDQVLSMWRGIGIALAGLGLGLVATALTLDRGTDPGRRMIGAWSREASVESAASDPYRRALLA